MNTRNREIQNETVRGITTNALFVKAFLINNLGTATAANVDFSKSIVKIILNRGGQQYIICQANLKLLGLASQLDRALQYPFGAGASMNVPSSVGSLMGFFIPFGGHINLKGDDNIYIELQNLDGLFTADIASTSFIETKLVKSVGYEQFIPSIQTWVIQPGETSRKYDLGDNVIKACILNYDKQSFLDNVIANLTLSSDRLNENFSFADLVIYKLNRFDKQLFASANPDLSASVQEDQCFTIIDFPSSHNLVFQQVEFDLNFQSAQVTAGNNYIVAWNYYTTPEILNKAAAMQAKHVQKAQEQVSNSVKK